VGLHKDDSPSFEEIRGKRMFYENQTAIYMTGRVLPIKM
jgi:hypothetical protein